MIEFHTAIKTYILPITCCTGSVFAVAKPGYSTPVLTVNCLCSVPVTRTVRTCTRCSWLQMTWTFRHFHRKDSYPPRKTLGGCTKDAAWTSEKTEVHKSLQSSDSQSKHCACLFCWSARGNPYLFFIFVIFVNFTIVVPRTIYIMFVHDRLCISDVYLFCVQQVRSTIHHDIIMVALVPYMLSLSSKENILHGLSAKDRRPRPWVILIWRKYILAGCHDVFYQSDPIV